VVSSFDQAILSTLNSFAGESQLVDHSIAFICGSDSVKGMLFVCILWAYWFRKGDAATVHRTRQHIVSTLAAGVFAIFLARVLALSLPFRIRPRFAPDAHFLVPASWEPFDLIDWSSFPSDHAVLFAALAMGLTFISRRVGIVALIYVLLAIGLPRVYLGYHYPSDVLVGMLLGMVVGYLFNSGTLRESLSRVAERSEKTSPALFYGVLLGISMQLATLFNDVRRMGLFLQHALRYFGHS
jgi:undecaprenyl-diphosphatase